MFYVDYNPPLKTLPKNFWIIQNKSIERIEIGQTKVSKIVIIIQIHFMKTI